MMKRIVLSVCAALAAAVVAQAKTYTWNAGSGTWSTPENWSPNGTPGSQDDVILPAPDDAANSYVVTADAAINVKSLTVGTDSDTITNGCTATFESKTVEMHHVAEDLVVCKGGVMTHTKGDDSTPYKLNLTVGGNATIAADGTIEANGKGNSSKGGKSTGWGFVGTYGGKTASSTGRCYGSIRKPEDLGSKGNAGPGGGAIRLNVSGTCRVDGSLTADSADKHGDGSGSGGSIWVTAGTLTGNGVFSTVSYGNSYGKGNGGRIAVKQTDATDFSACAVIFNYGNGTLYRESAGDESERGELTMNGAGTREFSTIVTDSEEPFGKITLVGTGGTISILDGVVVSTCGDFCAAGWTVEAAAGTTGGVNVLGPQDGTVRLAGTMTLGAFICTNGTKEVEFAKGMTVSVADNGVLWLEGANGVKTVLKSSEEGAAWYLTAGANLTGKVRNLDVSDSDASGGRLIKARQSIGRKGRNLNWEFPAGFTLVVR